MRRILVAMLSALLLAGCNSMPTLRHTASTAPRPMATTTGGFQFPPGVIGDLACLREGNWTAYAQNELAPPNHGAFLYDHPYGSGYGATRVGSVVGNDRVAIVGYMAIPQRYWRAPNNDSDFKGEVAYYVYNLTRPGNVGWVGNYGLRNTPTSPVDDPALYRFDPDQAVEIRDGLCRLSFG